MAGGKKDVSRFGAVGLRVSCTENKDTPIVKIILARRFPVALLYGCGASIGPTGHCNAATRLRKSSDKQFEKRTIGFTPIW